jgi:outer membrane protein assembly factor BamB
MTKLRFFGLAVLAAFFLLAPLSAQITTFSFERTFLNPSPDPGDGFGSYMTAAIPNGAGGYNVVIGAFLDDTKATDAGAVYVMDRATGGLIRTLYSPHPAAGDAFGGTVGAIGNNILVGATGDSTAGPGRGAAYLFDGATGAPLLTFLPPPASVGAGFGFPVVVAGDLNGDGKPEILVGGASDSVTGIAGAGAVYLFNGATGALLRTIENPEPDYYDIFGIFVAADGGKILVGAAWDKPSGVYQSGSAYLFDANSGALLRRFNSPTLEYQAHFGEWLAISQNRVVVTAHLADGGAFNAGAAYIFDADTGALLHTLLSPAPEVWGQFGYGLAVTGSDVLVGSSGEDGGNGAAYLFDAVTGQLTWSFHPPTPGLDPSWGLPVGFVGRDVLVGGWGNNTTPQSGSVSLFKRIGPLYGLCLLYDPFKIAKSGSTIPIKLQLCDGSGSNLSSAGIVLHALSIRKVSDGTSGSVDDSGRANPDSDFRYDGGGYVFNLSTKGLPGGTYVLNFTAGNDPSIYQLQFQVKS